MKNKITAEEVLRKIAKRNESWVYGVLVSAGEWKINPEKLSQLLADILNKQNENN